MTRRRGLRVALLAAAVVAVMASVWRMDQGVEPARPASDTVEGGRDPGLAGSNGDPGADAVSTRPAPAGHAQPYAVTFRVAFGGAVPERVRVGGLWEADDGTGRVLEHFIETSGLDEPVTFGFERPGRLGLECSTSLDRVRVGPDHWARLDTPGVKDLGDVQLGQAAVRIELLDAATGKPMPFVTVKLERPDDEDVRLATRMDGRATHPAPLGASWTATVVHRSPHYAPIEPITVVSGFDVTTLRAHELPSLEVRATWNGMELDAGRLCATVRPSGHPMAEWEQTRSNGRGVFFLPEGLYEVLVSYESTLAWCNFERLPACRVGPGTNRAEVQAFVRPGEGFVRFELLGLAGAEVEPHVILASESRRDQAGDLLAFQATLDGPTWVVPLTVGEHSIQAAYRDGAQAFSTNLTPFAVTAGEVTTVRLTFEPMCALRVQKANVAGDIELDVASQALGDDARYWLDGTFVGTTACRWRLLDRPKRFATVDTNVFVTPGRYRFRARQGSLFMTRTIEASAKGVIRLEVEDSSSK
ncbi:MAG: hypothetical protein AB7T63_02180 [Planctomycetota bacterium]